MRAVGRLLTLAAFHVILGAGVAGAQTVLIRNAPVDSNVEVVLNAAPVGSNKVGAAGLALVGVDLQKQVNKTETDAQIFVDVCDNNTRRVVIVERALTPPPPDVGCARRDMGGLFLVKQISTVVIDFGGPSPTLLLRQGKVSLAPPRSWDGGRTGLILSAAAALTQLADATANACGNVTNCSGDKSGFGYSVGAEYWFTPLFAAAGSYVRPAKATATGTGDKFRFNTDLEPELVTAAGKIGIPAGRMRFFGHIGATYTRATLDTNQTIDATTVTIDGVETAVPGGTQTYNVETKGWGWFFGGGAEFWATGAFAIYGEFDRSWLKGSATKNAEGVLDERLTSVAAGIKVKVF
jgi:Outer membrane protein beta-barrel domain